MVPRPWMRLSCCSNCCSLTASAFGLTEPGCWAATGAAAAARRSNATTTNISRMQARTAAMGFLPSTFERLRAALPIPCQASGRDGFTVGGLPSPGAGAITALGDAVLVNLGDDVAVAGEQRLGRAHLRAQRQLALGDAIGAVFLVFGRRVVGLRPAVAVGAFVHLAARAEIADPRILRRAERTGVEAVAAADANVLGV